MDIRVLVFNSGTYHRADLSRKSEDELWNLYLADMNTRKEQVQMYYLDEFSCAFNDEEVSDQDWLYFVDYDNITNPNHEERKYVWVFTAEQVYSDEPSDLVVETFATREAAQRYLKEFLHDGEEDSIAADVERLGWEVEDNSPDVYRAFAGGYYMSDHVELMVSKCKIKD